MTKLASVERYSSPYIRSPRWRFSRRSTEGPQRLPSSRRGFWRPFPGNAKESRNGMPTHLRDRKVRQPGHCSGGQLAQEFKSGLQRNTSIMVTGETLGTAEQGSAPSSKAGCVRTGLPACSNPALARPSLLVAMLVASRLGRLHMGVGRIQVVIHDGRRLNPSHCCHGVSRTSVGNERYVALDRLKSVAGNADGSRSPIICNWRAVYTVPLAFARCPCPFAGRR
jgi:hypothetical protein